MHVVRSWISEIAPPLWVRREGPGQNPGPSQDGWIMSRCFGRLRFGWLVVAIPSALEVGLRLQYALEIRAYSTIRSSTLAGRPPARFMGVNIRYPHPP